MAYDLNKNDIFNFASSFQAETKQKGDELFFKHCPYCAGGQSKDKDTFSINLKNGTYKCFRSSCGQQGHFVELARDFGYKLDYGEDTKAKVYKNLRQNPITVRDKAVEYMKSRGISEAITKRYRITTRKDDDSIIVFPFLDENGKLTFVKYRNTDKQRLEAKKYPKEWSEKDTKPILFGMAQCKNFDKLIITEGQIDSLTLAECRINNAVSVPTGAQGFTFLQHVWDWIIKFKEIIVFGDYERGQMSLLDEFLNRLPKDIKIKAVQPADYLDKKDANDIYRTYGKKAILKAVQNAQVPVVKQIKRLSEVKSLDLMHMPKLRTYIYELDRILSGGIYFGQIVLLTGKRGEGKSTLMSQIIAESLNQGFPSLVYSGELTDYHFKYWLDLQLAGDKYVNEKENSTGQKVPYINNKTAAQISNWYADLAYIYDNSAVDDENESLLDTVESAICRQGIKVICIDNLMTALDVSPSSNLYQAQSAFVKRLARLTRKYNVLTILVAHPRKTTSGQRGQIDNDDVSGSSDLTNAVDIALSYSRNQSKANVCDCDSRLSIIKNRLTGKLAFDSDAIPMYFSEKTKRIASTESLNCPRKYGWEVPDFNMSEWEEI